jgi:putative redox protein
MIRCERQGPDFRVQFSNGTFAAVCDATPDKGGQGAGFRPHELLEAALGSCTAIILDAAAKARGIHLDGLNVTVTLNRDEDPAVAAYTCAIELIGDLTPEQRDRLMRVARACPVRNTLSRKVTFRETSVDA